MDSNEAPAKEAEAAGVPPFLTHSQPPTPAGPTGRAVRMVQIDPFQLKLPLTEPGPCRRTLQLTNVSGLRIAWRIRSNEPTRYIVNPACGFLTANEAQTVSVELTDVNRYSERHRFMVQAMEAKDDEKDRRRVWTDPRASQLELVQSTRVFTLPSGPVVSEHSLVSASSTHSSVVSGSVDSSNSTVSSLSCSSSGSSYTTTSDSSSAYATESSSSVASRGSNSDWNDRIAELTVRAKESLASKERVSQQMVAVVNEVKRLEVELDRATQQTSELDARAKTLATAVQLLEKRKHEADEEIKALLKNCDSK